MLVLDSATQIASVGGAQVQLSSAELATITVLIGRRNAPMTRDAIANVLGEQGIAVVPRMVDVIICRLRQKLTPIGMGALIVTAWGRGYVAGIPPRDEGGPLAPGGGGSIAALLTA